jgi:tetratricopeptide (TPR) repeat protein
MTPFDRYRHAQRLFTERRYIAAARELEHLLAETRDASTHDAITHDAMTHDAMTGTVGLGDAPLLLARSYYHSAQLGRAEATARALVEADPTDVYAVLLLARSLQRRGRHAEAATWLRRLDGMGYDTWSDEFSPVASEAPVMPPRPRRTQAA